ncbi:MAG: hypothetical protein PUE18_06765 [Firmicutes bacterium]|nr:hypothetical protein [Bacillota bacterium]
MKRTITILVCIALVLCMIPMNVYAASLIVSPSTSTVAPGGTFTVNITGSECAGRVDISVSNGTASSSSVWVDNNSASVTVTAGSSGSTVITATPYDMADNNADVYNPGIQSVSVSIVAPSKPESKPSTSTNASNSNKPSNNRGDFRPEEEGLPKAEEEPEEPVRPEQFEVIIGEKTYVILENLTKKDAPDGFKLGETTYDSWPVNCFISKDDSMVLMLLQVKDVDEKAFFVYDEANQTFSPSIPVSVSDYLEKSLEYKQLKELQKEVENSSNTLAVVLGILLIVSVIGNGFFLYNMYKTKGGFNIRKKQ